MIRKKPIDFILEKKRREKQLMEYKRKSNSHNLNPSTNIEVQPDKENVMSKDRTRVNKLIKVDKLINRKENIMEEPILSDDMFDNDMFDDESIEYEEPIPIDTIELVEEEEEKPSKLTQILKFMNKHYYVRTWFGFPPPDTKNKSDK